MFKNREEAAMLLFEKLKSFEDRKDILIASIPRGGVVLGKIIADKLNLPHDAIIVKKIGAPDNPELAIGAVGPKKLVFWDKELLERIKITEFEMDILKKKKEKELEERELLLRGRKKPYEISGKTVILVDDGVATGATVLCACNFLKKEKAKEIILATPVISKDTLSIINKYFDEVVSLEVVDGFYAVGQFYEYFPQITDNEVLGLLKS